MIFILLKITHSSKTFFLKSVLLLHLRRRFGGSKPRINNGFLFLNLIMGFIKGDPNYSFEGKTQGNS